MNTRTHFVVWISFLTASALLVLYACRGGGGGGSPPASFTGVFTQRYDAQRTGQNRQEFALTPATVTPSTFGKLFACAVDGEVYAQPLYAANLAIAAGTHNVVFVATMNDSVYAFDADARPCVQYWKKSFLGTGITTVPPADTGEAGDINTIIGITGTPVIDPATRRSTSSRRPRNRPITSSGCMRSISRPAAKNLAGPRTFLPRLRSRAPGTRVTPPAPARRETCRSARSGRTSDRASCC